MYLVTPFKHIGNDIINLTLYDDLLGVQRQKFYLYLMFCQIECK